MGPGVDGNQGVASFLWRRPRLQLSLLLAGPVGWLLVAYLGSLAVLFLAAFWRLDTFSGQVVQEYGLDNFRTLVENDVYRQIALRTVLIAAAVTVTDAILAFPIAFYMAKVARPRVRGILVVAVVVPLWSAYLVKALAGRGILSQDGILNWALDPFGLSGPGFGNVATWLVFSYLWLPFMVLPLALPAVVAGSIFTFSLTLGDYITPQIVSSTQFIGNVVYTNVGVANNLPLAAAFATVPVMIMILYLLGARKLGAFESL